MSAVSPRTAKLLSRLEDVIEGWQAFQLAVEHQFSRNDFGEKVRELAEDLEYNHAERIKQRKAGLTSFELEDFLSLVLAEDYNTVVEDGTTVEVAAVLEKIFSTDREARAAAADPSHERFKMAAGSGLDPLSGQSEAAHNAAVATSNKLKEGVSFAAALRKAGGGGSGATANPTQRQKEDEEIGRGDEAADGNEDSGDEDDGSDDLDEDDEIEVGDRVAVFSSPDAEETDHTGTVVAIDVDRAEIHVQYDVADGQSGVGDVVAVSESLVEPLLPEDDPLQKQADRLINLDEQADSNVLADAAAETKPEVTATSDNDEDELFYEHLVQMDEGDSIGTDHGDDGSAYASADAARGAGNALNSNSEAMPTQQTVSTKQKQHHAGKHQTDKTHHQQQQQRQTNFDTTISGDRMGGATRVSQNVAGGLKRASAQHAKNRNRHTGRDDRATNEQVMDPRTKMMIFRLVSNRTLDSFHGCISTGKEANVYHAFSSKDWDADAGETDSQNGLTQSTTQTEVAVKVFKTAILVFKDRDKYVTGEHRYRNGYCKKNPRKMVKVCSRLESVRAVGGAPLVVAAFQ